MEFVGFQHSFPVFLLSLIWLGSILLIWWSYSKEKKLDSKIGLGLSTLRTLSVSILFLLILNPIFFSSDLKNSPQKMMENLLLFSPMALPFIMIVSAQI